MSSISVVLAVYNEEKTLADCLTSVKDLADEIVVVDGTSSDRTVEVAREFGAKVTITDNPPIFHINKQKAIDKATMDWILQLDADERVTPELAREIKEATSKANDVNGYWLPRKNWYLGRFLMKGGQYPDYTLRLYRRGKGKLPQKDVHEQAVVEGSVAYLKHPLIHIADPSFKRYLLRFRRYTTLFAKELKGRKTSKNPFVALKYLIALPTWWFLLTYIRHKGFMDSWQGFVFSFFSAARFPVAYTKYLFNKV
jgi:glycosyltransferase involved in cell wall biosynthesis